MVMTEAADRDPRGRFRPGRSGNPKGKPPGTPNRATALRRMLRAGEDDQAARVVIERATGGDQVAARYLLDRLEPRPRARPLPLELAPDADVGGAYEALFVAFATGTISPDEALTAARFLDRLGPARAEAAAAGQARGDAVNWPALFESENRQLRSELSELRIKLFATENALAQAREARPAEPAAPLPPESPPAKSPPAEPSPAAPPAAAPRERHYALPAPGARLNSTCILQEDGAPPQPHSQPPPPASVPTRSHASYWTGRRRQRQRHHGTAWGA
jgi:Family of unknown function (DUF5681)